jgi:hypothetical protein
VIAVFHRSGCDCRDCVKGRPLLEAIGVVFVIATVVGAVVWAYLQIF